MRIAISGSHCTGKSTLVEDFIATHQDYLHEPEAYEWLQEMYGEMLTGEPTVDDFYRQLEVSVERLRCHKLGDRVIAERSPLDFLAYIHALTDLGRNGPDCQMVTNAAELAAAGMAMLDLLVVLPVNDKDAIVVPASEDPELREAMNDRLIDLVFADRYSLFVSGQPRVIEVHGDRLHRVRILEQAVAMSGF